MPASAGAFSSATRRGTLKIGVSAIEVLFQVSCGLSVCGGDRQQDEG
jgi:hypothetical protein